MRELRGILGRLRVRRRSVSDIERKHKFKLGHYLSVALVVFIAALVFLLPPTDASLPQLPRASTAAPHGRTRDKANSARGTLPQQNSGRESDIRQLIQS